MPERRHMRYWLALVLAVIFAVGYAYQRDLRGLARQSRTSREDVRRLQEDLDALQDTEEELRLRVEGLTGDPVEIEASIRRSKNLVREGERVYRIELEEDTGDAGASDPGNQGA